MLRHAELRRTPAGMLVLAALLALFGAGLVLGAAYVALARRDVSWVVWASALAVGPLTLYVALHLARRTHWAWLALVMVLVMLLASSAWRLVAAAGLALSPIAEIASEVLALAYLLRPGVRAALRDR
jgi:hypothetical protein